MKNLLAIKSKNSQNFRIFTDDDFNNAIFKVLNTGNKIKFLTSVVVKDLIIKNSKNFNAKKYKNHIVKIERFYLIKRDDNYYLLNNAYLLKPTDTVLISNFSKFAGVVCGNEINFYLYKLKSGNGYFATSHTGLRTPTRRDFEEAKALAEKRCKIENLKLLFNRLNLEEKQEFIDEIVKFEIKKELL